MPYNLTILVVLNQSWCHSHAINCVAILFELRQALALWVCCNGTTNLSSATGLAAGSKGSFYSKIMLNQSFEAVVQDYFFTYGHTAASEAKSALFHLLTEHLYYTPDMVELDHDMVDSLQGIYQLLHRLERIEMGAGHVP